MANDDSRRLSELTLGEAKRILVYGTALVLAIVLFFMLVGKVLVALLLGIVALIRGTVNQAQLADHRG